MLNSHHTTSHVTSTYIPRYATQVNKSILYYAIQTYNT